MSDQPTVLSVNGRGDPVFRTALVIDTDVSRQIAARTALRQTGLFSLVLSCESNAIAREVIEDDSTPTIHLALLDADMAGACLPLMSPGLAARTVLTHDAEVSPDTDLLALPHPLSPAVIEDVFQRLPPLD
ncbi:MAG: hypothetical protein AAF762_14890 [Pseudomonadota bacterium]